MTYRELIRGVAVFLGVPYIQAKRVADQLFRHLGAAVHEHGRVAVPDFGAFYRKTRIGMRVVPPGKQAEMQTKPSATVGLRSAKKLRRQP